jgi:hypothetical protein
VFHKVHISKEARFDYEEIVVGASMPAAIIKKELEEYFSYVKPVESYFTIKLYDEQIQKMLLLFFRKGIKFKCMQIWILAGICDIDDYNQALEERGLIKNWLDALVA